MTVAAVPGVAAANNVFVGVPVTFSCWFFKCQILSLIFFSCPSCCYCCWFLSLLVYVVCGCSRHFYCRYFSCSSCCCWLLGCFVLAAHFLVVVHVSAVYLFVVWVDWVDLVVGLCCSCWFFFSSPCFYCLLFWCCSRCCWFSCCFMLQLMFFRQPWCSCFCVWPVLMRRCGFLAVFRWFVHQKHRSGVHRFPSRHLPAQHQPKRLWSPVQPGASRGQHRDSQQLRCHQRL